MLQVSFKQDQLIQFAITDPQTRQELQNVHSRIPQAGPVPGEAHELVASLLRHCVDLVEVDGRIPAPLRNLLSRHVTYHRGLIAQYSPTDLREAANGFELLHPSVDMAHGIRQCVGELLSHVAAGFDSSVQLLPIAGSVPLVPSALSPASPLLKLVPNAVLNMRTEANLNVIAPWFMRSLGVPGDVCEFGCFRGTMSIKFAYALKTLGIDKTVYAFDTFEGFLAGDPDGGPIGVGYYDEGNSSAFDQLMLWSKAIPVVPVRGDATATCKTLSKPLSFVWLDLDHGALMRPVFDTIWPLLSAETLVGVDDVGRTDEAGRPITPGVELWIDEMVAAKRLIELERHDGAYVRLYKPNK